MSPPRCDYVCLFDVVKSVFYKFSSNYIVIMSVPTEIDGSPIKPLGDKVVVRPLTAEENGTTSASGIIIPDTAKKEKPEQGIVLAVGPGKWNEDGDKRLPVEVKVGDRIVFSKYGYDEVKVDGKEYFLVSENSVLGIFNSK
jgi:chaperonin GroES